MALLTTVFTTVLLGPSGGTLEPTIYIKKTIRSQALTRKRAPFTRRFIDSQLLRRPIPLSFIKLLLTTTTTLSLKTTGT